NDLPAARLADQERPDGEPAALHGFMEVASPADVHRPWITARVAEEQAAHIRRSECEEFRIATLDPRQIGVAARDVLGLDRRQLRQRDQDLPDPLHKLLLLGGAEYREAERLILHLDLARAAQVELVIGLDRDHGEKRDRDEQEKPR